MTISFVSMGKKDQCAGGQLKKKFAPISSSHFSKRGDKSGDYHSIYIRTSPVRIIRDNTQSFSHLRSFHLLVSSENGVSLYYTCAKCKISTDE